MNLKNIWRKSVLIRIAVILVSSLILLFLFLRFLPYPELENFKEKSYGFTLLDKNGKTLRNIPAEDGVKREWMTLDAIPKNVINIFIKAEDKRFFYHFGVDPIAAAAALYRNLRTGRTVSGASTITMQLARLINPRSKTFGGKLMEVYDALRLEARLSKKQILELWLNNIPFGSNIEGLPAAARAKFGRDITQLNDAHILLLAVIPRRPGLYDPAINAQAASSAALSLSRLCGMNFDEEAITNTAKEAQPEYLQEEKIPFYAPHFTDRAAAIIRDRKVNSPVYTTLDLDLQLYAEKRLLSELSALEYNRVSNGAILVIENDTGEILTYVGSASWFDDIIAGKIDGIRVRNQPGSCLKPFLYALALEEGFLPNDILPDIPTVFGSREAYSPGNFNRRFNGPVRFRIALASSLNVPSVYLLQRLGVRNFEDWLAALGFESIASNRGNYGAGLALGNAEVSLEELTRAFSVFPRGGLMMDIRFFPDQKVDTRQLISAYSNYVITDILSDKASRFIGFGPAPALATEFPSMFKTGTANQFQHIWAFGASPRYTVGVWMGNFSGETVIGRTGSSIPARIASDLLNALEQGHSQNRDFPIVKGNTRDIKICALSGMTANPSCFGSIQEQLPIEILPALCNWHRSGDGAPVYPPEYQAWLAERFRQGQTLQGGSANIRLPVQGSVFYFNPALPPQAQAIRLETSGFGPEAYVYANDVLQGSLNHAGVFALPLQHGRNRILVEDENNAAMVEFEVR